MKHIIAIARKEMRATFRSEVALSFLAVFLGVVVFTFFWVEKFFTRNVADVRPLFEWLPLLLIFLVAALSMRLWSEERKAGTIEILLTLPVPHWKLVVGKFIAGMALVGLALLLTLGLPITVDMMGELDWGPVIGGYLAALLLASAYLSIGLCVSAASSEQLVSLIVTAAICALLYLPGADDVVRFFGGEAGEILRRISTRGRFESIARGVLDLRDLAYYLSVIAIGLTVNVFLLKARGWSRGPRTRPQRRGQALAVALVVANALALNLWMAPVTAARVDLTASGEYSLSPVTRELVGALDQPLVIRGYFSEKTHPKLAPLVPQMRDLLAEYKVVGGKNVRVEFVDPGTSEEVEKEAQERYGIKSFPFRFEDRHERSVVNAYFHLLIQYGDQFEVLDFEDLIEVRQTDIGDIEVKLRNFEYDVTRTIKKVAYGFQSLEVLFASLAGKAELTAYITPKLLPGNLREVPKTVEEVAGKLKEQAGGNFSYQVVEPDSREAQQALYQRYGFQPFVASLSSNEGFYLHFVLTVGKKEIPILPPQDLSASSLEQVFVEGLQRAAPGFIKTVAVWTPPAEQQAPPMQGMPPQRPRPPQTFELLREKLSGSYEVVPADLSTGHVDDDVEVLLLAGPTDLDDTARRAVDQFVMRGGALIVLSGRYRLDLSAQALKVEQVTTGLEPLLEAWGVTVEPTMVLDSRNDSFPIPVERDLGGLVVRDIQELPYPFFVKVPRDGMSDGIITGQLATAVLHFASPIRVDEPKRPAGEAGEAPPAPAVEVLLRSSGGAWQQTDTTVQPDFRLHPETGFARPKEVPEAERGPHTLAVSVTGSLPSGLAADEAAGAAEAGAAPDGADTAKDGADAAKDGAGAAKDGADAAKEGERLIRRSPPDARVVVVGSSAFVSDELLQLSSQVGSDYVLNNVEMIQNMVDWAVADTDLLTIRSRGTHTRLLEIEPDARRRWEWTNYAIMVLGFAVIVIITVLRQRNQLPMELDPRPAAPGDESDEAAADSAAANSAEDSR